jgi:hypothetical protein
LALAFSSSLIVVISQFDAVGVTFRKAKNNPPVVSHRYRPRAFHVAPEGVQMKAGHAHVLNGLGSVELCKDGTYLVAQGGPNLTGIVLFKKTLQTPVPKADYHIVL